METRAAAQRWADTWQRNWIAGRPEPIAALYGPGASYAVSPFREPNIGPEGALAYVSRVLSEESDVTAHFGEPIVDGRRAAIQWWATYVEAGGDITLAGTSVLRFDADGLVIDEWDAWEEMHGRRSPDDGWGRAE